MNNSNNDKSTKEQQQGIERAATEKNPMDTVENFGKYVSSNGNEYSLFCRTKPDMDNKLLKWAFKLAERNVSPFYKSCSMGWQPKVKQTHLNKNWARYLIAEDKTGKPIAYAMFRFDMDYGFSVLYCYEIQIEYENRRDGLGKFIMSMLENCAQRWSLEKVVLTVLKNNLDAMEFFNSIGYQLDSSSPTPLEKAEYVILSKRIK